MFNSTKYNSPRIQRINMIFNKQNLKSSMPIKNLIVSHPVIFLVISFVTSVLYFSGFILILERPSSIIGDGQLVNWSQSSWYVIVTMTTIGYGDIVSNTLITRILVMFIVIWGNFWDSIFLSTLYPYMIQNIQEKKAYNLFNRIKIRNKKREISIRIIQKFFKIILTNKKLSKKNKEIKKLNNQLFFLLQKKRKINKKMMKVVHETFYFIDDILLDLELLTMMSGDQLMKVERIFKSIKDILKIASKKHSKENPKKSITHNYNILEIDTNHIYIKSHQNKRQTTKLTIPFNEADNITNPINQSCEIVEKSFDEDKVIHFYNKIKNKNDHSNKDFDKKLLHEHLSEFLKNK